MPRKLEGETVALTLAIKAGKESSIKETTQQLHERLLQIKHMKPVNEIPPCHYFMPHHCLFKPESTITKLPVVFDT